MALNMRIEIMPCHHLTFFKNLPERLINIKHNLSTMDKKAIQNFDAERGMNLPSFMANNGKIYITYEERKKMWKYLIAAERKAKKAKKI